MSNYTKAEIEAILAENTSLKAQATKNGADDVRVTKKVARKNAGTKEEPKWVDDSEGASKYVVKLGQAFPYERMNEERIRQFVKDGIHIVACLDALKSKANGAVHTVKRS